MFLAHRAMVYMFLSLFVLQECVLMLITSTTETYLLKHGYRYDKIRKAFSKVYSVLIFKYKIGLKTLLKQGISESIFYGDLVYIFKKNVGNPRLSDQFKTIIKRYKKVGYNLYIMRQSACLVLNPITVYSYGFLGGSDLDSMAALT